MGIYPVLSHPGVGHSSKRGAPTSVVGGSSGEPFLRAMIGSKVTTMWVSRREAPRARTYHTSCGEWRMLHGDRPFGSLHAYRATRCEVTGARVAANRRAHNVGVGPFQILQARRPSLLWKRSEPGGDRGHLMGLWYNRGRRIPTFWPNDSGACRTECTFFSLGRRAGDWAHPD